MRLERWHVDELSKQIFSIFNIYTIIFRVHHNLVTHNTISVYLTYYPLCTW